MDISKGRYWDKGVELVSGCTPCSPGCEKCWSASMTHRFKHPKSDSHIHDGLMTDDSGRFTGVIYTHPERLSIPLKRRKPTVFAVWNDLFHEAAPDEFIAQTYQTIYDSRFNNHTFLILTKRPQRMAEIVRRLEGGSLCSYWDGDESGAEWVSHSLGDVFPTVYHGLTVCNQAEADEKIPIMTFPFWLSIEPMLSPILIRWYLDGCHYGGKKLIQGIVLGGETGPGARPLHPDWVRSVRDQCAAAGVPFFFKQWGEWAWQYEARVIDNKGNVARRDKIDIQYNYAYLPDGKVMNRIGRKKAGRLLDGRTHDDLPWRAE